ncbi:MAG: phosphonopyruvate decarboxylase [Ruminococcaceae bacterium]|nr:phosphonopyruvate decarboxylase [Oscillospiraceae bacterium]
MKLEFLEKFDFFTGVPDSLLRPFCDWVMDRYGISKNHIIAANEGNAVALAAGYHLSTGKVPVVYMQNSGIGNIINPVASLMNTEVYGIPCVFIVGWRAEPGVHDEPQHIYQGKVTVKLLEDMDIETFIISKETTEKEVLKQLEEWQPLLDKGKQVAFVVKKGALEFHKKIKYQNNNALSREEIIERIVKVSGEDAVISTTGKASRELFEIREREKQGHGYDFLTVGSMGHSSSIALSVALNRKNKKVWCIDGDGAALMHLGSMAVIGANAPKNLVHIVINNASHETVGGMPTVAEKIDFVAIAKGCGYKNAVSVDSLNALDKALMNAKQSAELCFIEVKCSIGSRADLGRPTTTAKQNKESFMKNL